MPLSPQEFVSKWKRVTSREKQTYQEHFIDLCRLLGQQTPNEADPTGTRYAFEMGAAKTSGGQGWADVAKLGYFGWEYKAKDADLDKAYEQLFRALNTAGFFGTDKILHFSGGLFAAYGWNSDLSDEEILERLLSLNLERAK